MQNLFLILSVAASVASAAPTETQNWTPGFRVPVDPNVILSYLNSPNQKRWDWSLGDGRPPLGVLPVIPNNPITPNDPVMISKRQSQDPNAELYSWLRHPIIKTADKRWSWDLTGPHRVLPNLKARQDPATTYDGPFFPLPYWHPSIKVDKRSLGSDAGSLMARSSFDPDRFIPLLNFKERSAPVKQQQQQQHKQKHRPGKHFGDKHRGGKQTGVKYPVAQHGAAKQSYPTKRDAWSQFFPESASTPAVPAANTATNPSGYAWGQGGDGGPAGGAPNPSTNFDGSYMPSGGSGSYNMPSGGMPGGGSYHTDIVANSNPSGSTWESAPTSSKRDFTQPQEFNGHYLHFGIPSTSELRLDETALPN